MLSWAGAMYLALTAAGSVRVQIDSGSLEGAWVDGRGGVVAFKGIRYASPPTGEWRWKPPRRVTPWKGVRAARELGPVCPQSDRWSETRKMVTTALGGDPSWVPPVGQMSEDCLSLNVWTSNLGRTSKHPVLVWLHGGGFSFGGGAEEAAALAPLGAVVVTLNYRLGLLGFMAHPSLAQESPHRSSGVYGLLDMIEALHWVQRNIAGFGGDPGRVTIFGHSAGGAAVLQLLGSPLARGLFHRAIAQSPGLGESRTRIEAEGAGLKVASELLGPAASPLPALRAVSPERLVAVGRGPFDPVTDGWAIPDPMPRALAVGHGNNVPLVIGATANEASVFALGHRLPEDLAGYHSLLDEPDQARKERLLKIYPASRKEEVPAATIRLVTERDFVCPARYIAARRRGATWLYLVSAPPTSGPAGARLGPYHGSDTRFLFNQDYGVPLDEAGQRVREAMRRYWVRFAATGDPNEGGLPEWPRYKGPQGRHLELGDPIRGAAGLGRERCDIFDEGWDFALARGGEPPG